MTTMQARPARREGVGVAPPEPRRDDDLAGVLAPLQPAGEVPLHLQLRNALDQAVDAVGLAHGERIWSESRLMRHYGVSRHVVRQALNQLVLEGRLSVRKGAGYFVNRRRVVKDLQAVLAATGQAIGAERYETELLDAGLGPLLDPEEADLVPRRHRPRVHRVRRLARVDDEPVALLTAAYPAAMARVLTRRVVASGGEPAALAQHGSWPQHADLLVGVTFASGAESVLLDVVEGAPLVAIRSRVRTEAGDLLALTRQVYRGDRFQFMYSADLGADGWALGSH